MRRAAGADGLQAWLAAERSLGRMHADHAPPDAPFGNATVARNFPDDRLRRRARSLRRRRAARRPRLGRILRRWQGPVRWAVHAASAERACVQPLVHGFATRLAGLTGLDFRPAGALSGPLSAPANLQVWVVPDGIERLLLSLPPASPAPGDARPAA